MLFNSYIFILFFLPVCIIGYFSLNHFKQKMLAQIFLLCMSLWFYAYFDLNYLFIILISIIGNYGFYLTLNRARYGSRRKILYVIALSFNLGILFYFKYYNFFLENINIIFKQDFNLKTIVLPLGISFFTFQQISFVIDTYKGEIPRYGFINYASFVTFFPQLIAGPIVTHDELIPQLMDESKKRFSWDNFARGIYIFSLGLSKKVLIADTFGSAANWGFANIARLDTTNALLTMLSYTIQIYFDFSGYCDMAIGIGRMMNIELPLNFNSPYKAYTITEFWSRWHITLTRFFTKYIYIPLGGNRGGTARTYSNVIIVFVLSGLWHGANWTFILWGIFHGIFSVITRRYKTQFEKLHLALNWIITFTFLNVTWVIFRADTIPDAIRLINRIFLFHFGEISNEIVTSFHLPELLFLNKKISILTFYPKFFLVSFLGVAFLLMLGSENAFEKMKKFKPTILNLIVTIILLVWCIFSFSGVSTFLYFNF